MQLADADEFMCLQAEPPAWVRSTEQDRCGQGFSGILTIHRLNEEVTKGQGFVRLWISRLGIHDLQFVTMGDDEWSAAFGAHADPVNARGNRDRAVRLDRYFEVSAVEFLDERCVELKQRLATRAYDEAPPIVTLWPEVRDRVS